MHVSCFCWLICVVGVAIVAPTRHLGKSWKKLCAFQVFWIIPVNSHQVHLYILYIFNCKLQPYYLFLELRKVLLNRALGSGCNFCCNRLTVWNWSRMHASNRQQIFIICILSRSAEKAYPVCILGVIKQQTSKGPNGQDRGNIFYILSFAHTKLAQPEVLHHLLSPLSNSQSRWARHDVITGGIWDIYVIRSAAIKTP